MVGGLLIEVLSTSLLLSLHTESFFSFAAVSRSRRLVDFDVTTVPVEETRDSGLVTVVVDGVDGECTTLRIFLGDSAFTRFEGDDGLTDATFCCFTDLFRVIFCACRLEECNFTSLLRFIYFAGCRQSDEEDFEELFFLEDDAFFPPCDLEPDDTLRWESVLEEIPFPLPRDEPFFTASLLSSESDDDMFEVNLGRIYMTTV